MTALLIHPSKKKDYTNSFVPMNKKAIFLIRVSDRR